MGSHSSSRLDLFDWQSEAVNEWLKNRSGIVVAAPGTGKTFIALELMKRYQLSRFLVVTPTQALAIQWRQKIRSIIEKRSIPLDINYMSPQTTIIVEVVNTIIRHEDIINDWCPNIIIFDEVHRYTSDVFQKVIKLPVSKKSDLMYGKLGLTATIPDPELRPNAHSILLKHVGEVIYSYTIAEARKDELLSPYSIFISQVGLLEDEEEELQKIEDRIQFLKDSVRKTFEARGLRFEISMLLRQHLPKEYKIPEIFQLRQAYFKRRHLNFKARNKIYNACLTVQILLKKIPDTQIMVYTMTIDTAEQVAKELERLEITSSTVHSQNDPSENHLALTKLRDRRLSVIISVRTLDEGIDLPQLRFLIIIANSKQLRQMLQRIGRTLRIDRENLDKQAYVIVFEVSGDEFDLASIEEGARAIMYYLPDQLEEFYQDLTKIID
ncbi:MAG: UvrABC system protein B [Candidatus Heimdallarchaeota archaeon LC_3]|nr:MAG: UvrABC system protein B [Candidatus Heimdallarchaeota archaeon LC_3]